MSAVFGMGGLIVSEPPGGSPAPPGPPNVYSSVIWRPGVPSSGNVYATWAEIEPVIAARSGFLTVFVDTSVTGGTAQVPATAATECFGRLQFSPYGPRTTNAQPVVEILDGGQLRNVGCFDGVICWGAPVAVPGLLCTIDAGVISFVNNARLQLNGGASVPILRMGGQGQRLEFLNGSFPLNAAGTPGLSVVDFPSATGVYYLNTGSLFGASFPNQLPFEFFQGPFGAQVYWHYDPSCYPNFQVNFGGAVFGRPSNTAPGVTYNDYLAFPRIGAEEVQAAIDALKRIDAKRITSKLDLYVAAGGNNANSGLSPTDAVRDLAGVWAKFEPATVLGSQIVVHVSSGAFGDWSSIPAFVKGSSDAQIAIVIDGAGQVGDDGLTQVDTGVIDGAGTSTGTIVATVPLAADYKGYTCEVTIGGQKHYRDIRGAVAEYLFLDAPLPAVPAGTFRIVEPAAVWTLEGNRDFSACPDIPCALINAGISDDGSGYALQARNMVCAQFFGLHFSNSAQLMSYRNGGVFGGQTSQLVPDSEGQWSLLWNALGTDYTDNWHGWGISSADHSPFNGLQPAQQFNGFFTCWGALEVYDYDNALDVQIWGGWCQGAFAYGGLFGCYDGLCGGLVMTDDAYGQNMGFSGPSTFADIAQAQWDVNNAGSTWLQCNFEAFAQITNSFGINAGATLAVFCGNLARVQFWTNFQFNMERAVLAYAGAQVLFSCPLHFTGNAAQDAVAVYSDASIIFRDVIDIDTCLNGLNCSGGGTAVLESFAGSAIVGAVSAEVRVSAALGTTLAAALPAVGSTYANPGGGSRITRAF